MGVVPELMPFWALCLAMAVTVFAGFVKGAVGFALPLIMVSGMATFLPPEIALAGMAAAGVIANVRPAADPGLQR